MQKAPNQHIEIIFDKADTVIVTVEKTEFGSFPPLSQIKDTECEPIPELNLIYQLAKA